MTYKNLQTSGDLRRTLSAEMDKMGSLHDVLYVALRGIAEFGGWSFARALLPFEGAEGAVASSDSWYEKTEGEFEELLQTSENLRFRKGDGLPGDVLDEQFYIIENNLAGQDDFYSQRLVNNHGIKSSFVLSVRQRGVVQGVLEFLHTDTVDVSDDFEAGLEDIAREIGHFLAYWRTKLDEKLHSLIISNLSEAVFVTNLQGRIFECNEAAPRIFGYEKEEFIGRDASFLAANPDEWRARRKIVYPSLDKDGAREDVIDVRRKNGDIVHSEMSLSAMKSEKTGERIANIAIIRDVTSRIRAERESRQLLDILEAAADFVAVTEPNGTLLYANKSLKDFLALEEGDPLPLAKDIVTPESYSFLVEEGIPSSEAGMPWRGEITLVSPNSYEKLPVSQIVVTHKDAEGRIIRYSTIARDISDSRKMEQALIESATLFRTLASFAPVGIFRMDPLGRCLYVNERWQEITGFFVDDALGMGWADTVHKDDWPEMMRMWEKCVADVSDYRQEYRITLPSGDNRWVLSMAKPEIDSEGHLVGYVGTITDLTERHKSEEKIKRSQEMLHQAQDLANMGSWEWNLVTDEIHFSQNMYPLLGIESVEGPIDPDFYLKYLSAEDSSAFQSLYESLLKGKNGDEFEHEFNAKDKQGRKIRFRGSARCSREENGRVTHIQGIIQDVTELRKAEDSLRQAQKMEAVGQLTGGIAHDFNNLLMAVIGNLEFLEEHIEGDAEAMHFLKVAESAADKGAKLTQHMLAFSRKQPLRPELVDVNTLVNELNDILERTIGVNMSIDLDLDDHVGSTRVDKVHLENAVLNLAINARDAMKGGGKLKISTRPMFLAEDTAVREEIIPAGEFLALTVSDTGTGISAEDLAHVFDPFFTTKDVGEGSGLGLSMVYGFARQSGGYVDVESEVGVGTRMSIYLPVIHTEEEAEEAVSQTPKSKLPRGDETILVVEDDEDVRHYVVGLLESLGYDVHWAGTGETAIEKLENMTAIDLLFSDVVLPGKIDGREIAAHAAKVRPEMKILLTSGYPNLRDSASGSDMGGYSFIEKPYRRADLARAIRDAVQTLV